MERTQTPFLVTRCSQWFGFLGRVGLSSALALILTQGAFSASPSTKNQSPGYGHDQTQELQKLLGIQVVYGEDNRKDLYQTTQASWLKLADSTVALVQSRDVSAPRADGTVTLRARSYRASYSLCAEERFVEQKAAAFCSGFLVGEDLMVTAGHCITSASSCAATRFVFGYGLRAPGAVAETVPQSEVYSCAEIVARKEEGRGADYAVIRLDRKVQDHSPLKMNRSSQLTVGSPLLVIGHPAGLPTKIADGANVRSGASRGFFVANLDTYGGNSGSAVFNAVTEEVEGILVRGEVDFVSRGSCNVSKVCENAGCRGEDVTSIAELKSFVPELK